MKNILQMTRDDLMRAIFDAAPRTVRVLRQSSSLSGARDRLFELFNSLERHYFNIRSRRGLVKHHIIERDNAKECIRVLKNLIRTENESLTSVSALQILHRMAQRRTPPDESTPAFLAEFLHLFRGMNARAGIVNHGFLQIPSGNCTDPQERSRRLDVYAGGLQQCFNRFRTGFDPSLRQQHRNLRRRLQRTFHASTAEWNNWRWQLSHVITDRVVLASAVHLEDDEVEGLYEADRSGIPFQVTPYYLSLFNADGRTFHDRGLRAQVLPSATYCRNLVWSHAHGENLDFMGEHETSPCPGITRRYPQIVILKPFDSCPQICVYCQRNWEIRDLRSAPREPRRVRLALDWIRRHPHVTEVLVTGGDPLTLNNRTLAGIIGQLAQMPQVERIRIGTRTPVTLPMRIDAGFLSILRRHHRWGRREITIMTHVEYPQEITPEFVQAITRLRDAGLNVYNQHVFTFYGSLRCQASFLRRELKRCGVDPYYTFNTKGKNETIDYRVPMARLQQERHEEARLMPGTIRTDEPVFNVPRQGKSSLVAWQDHEPIMILPNGSRVYRFYPWESRIAFADDYLYTDVPIYDYLARLSADGEDIGKYSSIWYYF